MYSNTIASWLVEVGIITVHDQLQHVGVDMVWISKGFTLTQSSSEGTPHRGRVSTSSKVKWGAYRLCFRRQARVEDMREGQQTCGWREW